MEIYKKNISECKFIENLNIAICEHPKGNWQTNIGEHLKNSNSVALFPEEILYLYNENKISFSEVESKIKLIEILCKNADLTINGTIFNMEIFAVYANLREKYGFVKRENSKQEIMKILQIFMSADTKNTDNSPIKKSKIEENSSVAEILSKFIKFRIAENSADAKKSAILVYVPIENKEKYDTTEICEFGKVNCKIAFVKESKIVILNFGIF